MMVDVRCVMAMAIAMAMRAARWEPDLSHVLPGSSNLGPRDDDGSASEDALDASWPVDAPCLEFGLTLVFRPRRWRTGRFAVARDALHKRATPLARDKRRLGEGGAQRLATASAAQTQMQRCSHKRRSFVLRPAKQQTAACAHRCAVWLPQWLAVVCFC